MSDRTRDDDDNIEYIETTSVDNIATYPIGIRIAVTHRGKQLSIQLKNMCLDLVLTDFISIYYSLFWYIISVKKNCSEKNKF